VTYVELASTTWTDVAALREQGAALGLLPLGALEQHGPHLPLATDMLIAAELGRRVAELLVEPVVVAPVFPAGLSGHHLAFPGTVTVSEQVFGSLLTAYVEAFERMGIERVAIFSAHGGNFAYLKTWLAQREQTAAAAATIAFTDLDRFLATAFEGACRGGLEPCPADSHAGAIETSLLLASSPELVRPFDGVEGYVGALDGLVARVFAEGLDQVSATGVLGDVRGASAEAGRTVYAALAEQLVDWIVAEL
jgi:creatinine amidohydrolase